MSKTFWAATPWIFPSVSPPFKNEDPNKSSGQYGVVPPTGRGEKQEGTTPKEEKTTMGVIDCSKILAETFHSPTKTGGCPSFEAVVYLKLETYQDQKVWNKPAHHCQKHRRFFYARSF